MCICIHVFVHVFYICDICTHFIYADFILLFYLWLLGQTLPNKEVQTNKHICASKRTIISSYNGLAPSRNLNQCWNTVNSNLRNKLQWNLERNSYIFIHENVFENVVCEMAAICLRLNAVERIQQIPKDLVDYKSTSVRENFGVIGPI